MANPNAAETGDGVRLGYFMKKVSSTLTAVLGRALTNAPTSGATDTGHLAIATHVDDDPALFADAGSATPVVLMAGKGGNHGTAYAAGDAVALQVNRTTGALLVTGGGAAYATAGTVTVASVGTAAALMVAAAFANRSLVRLQNSGTANLHYGYDSGIGTATRSLLIEPGGQDEIALGTAVTVYVLAAAGSVTYRAGEYA
jgi:hypothetical protein